MSPCCFRERVHRLTVYTLFEGTSPETRTSSQTNPPSVRLILSLDTVYYPVTGTTTQDIFDSVERNGPEVDEVSQGHFASGLTESESSYQIEFLDRGESCELQSAVINLSLVVTLPQHSSTSSLSNLQLGRWQDFAEGVAVHEQNHVDIHIDRIEAFKKRLESLSEKFSDCDSLESSAASAQGVERSLNDREQEAFHESEEQLSQRLREPVQRQINENELRLAELRDELTLVSLEIEEFEVQIDDVERSMQPYDAKISAMRDQYPDLLLPPDAFDEYERLLGGWNRLNDLRNGLITHVKALVEQHNRTVQELNRLTEQTNQIIGELAWLP